MLWHSSRITLYIAVSETLVMYLCLRCHSLFMFWFHWRTRGTRGRAGIASMIPQNHLYPSKPPIPDIKTSWHCAGCVGSKGETYPLCDPRTGRNCYELHLIHGLPKKRRWTSVKSFQKEVYLTTETLTGYFDNCSLLIFLKHATFCAKLWCLF